MSSKTFHGLLLHGGCLRLFVFFSCLSFSANPYVSMPRSITPGISGYVRREHFFLQAWSYTVKSRHAVLSRWRRAMVQ